MSVMIVFKATAVFTGKGSDGPQDMILQTVATIIGAKPEAQHARFLGYVRAVSLAFIAKSGPYETTDGSAR